MAVVRRFTALLVSASMAAVACGGEGSSGESTPVPPVNQQAQTRSTEPTLQPLQREAFSYEGSGRDPFVSLLQSGDVRPLLQDLRVTSVTYDTRNPRNSVAVLRDTVENKAYPVHVGDELGRMRILAIRPGEVEVVVQEFGADRRIIIRQRRRGGTS